MEYGVFVQGSTYLVFLSSEVGGIRMVNIVERIKASCIKIVKISLRKRLNLICGGRGYVLSRSL